MTTTVVGFVSHIEQFKAAFPELYRLRVIAICLPVSTASCDRSFSDIKTPCRLRNWAASPFLPLNVSGLMQSLDNDEVIDAFAAVHKNRRIKLN